MSTKTSRRKFLQCSVAKWKQDNQNVLLRTLGVSRQYVVVHATLVACNKKSPETDFSINERAIQDIIDGDRLYSEYKPAPFSEVVQIWNMPPSEGEDCRSTRFFMETEDSVYELGVKVYFE